MTKDELSTIGKHLYGPKWKGKLAEELGRSRFTVYRWARTGVPSKSSATRIRSLATSPGKENKSRDTAGRSGQRRVNNI